jgi:high-affinity Fe2+/Pb2+ permease
VALPDDSNISEPNTSDPKAAVPEAAAQSGAVHDVLVRRSPRYVRFIALGAAVAIVITLVLTFAFPEQPNYSRAQVFGFVGIILVTVFVGLSATVAILLDRASARRARTLTMRTSERVETENLED